jgi:hypothetical protein
MFLYTMWPVNNEKWTYRLVLVDNLHSTLKEFVCSSTDGFNWQSEVLPLTHEDQQRLHLVSVCHVNTRKLF